MERRLKLLGGTRRLSVAGIWPLPGKQAVAEYRCQEHAATEGIEWPEREKEMWGRFMYSTRDDDGFDDLVIAETEDEAKKEAAEMVARFSPGFEGCGRSFVKGERMWRITPIGWEDYRVYDWEGDYSPKCGTYAGTPVPGTAFCEEIRCQGCIVSAGIEY